MIEATERARALTRLYQRQLDKQDSKLPEPKRKLAAAKAMDDLIGPEWRKAVQTPEGGQRVPAEVLVEATKPDDAFVLRIKMDDCPEPTKAEAPAEPDWRRQLTDIAARVKRLLESSESRD